MKAAGSIDEPFSAFCVWNVFIILANSAALTFRAASVTIGAASRLTAAPLAVTVVTGVKVDVRVPTTRVSYTSVVVLLVVSETWSLHRSKSRLPDWSGVFDFGILGVVHEASTKVFAKRIGIVMDKSVVRILDADVLTRFDVLAE